MIAAFFAAALAATEHSAVSAGVTIQVSDRDAAAASVVARAESMGGWFSSLSEEAVVVQVPTARAQELLDHARGLGRAVQRDYASEDLGPALEDERARLKAREEVLGRYMEVLGEAKAESIVAVQREIARVVAEIEESKGRIRLLEHRSTWARAAVSFEFRDRTAPSRDGTSSFRWINTVNLADLMADFQAGQRRWRSGGVGGVVPEGFAPYRRPGRLQAVHPDDLMYRVRRMRNRPRADLAFWREALRTRMEEAGYRLVAESDVQAGSTPGALIELSAPNGNEDMSYVLALFVEGRRLYLVEAAGEVGRFAPHREAVLAAIRGLRP